ncbi:MFS transporter [Candidatus Formimonas warabiya]|uniref:MFS transporter n=1 Tax=Formimonas warabiya TaxID=1761012 RepID=A0A3G1L0G2_FORW1|nr:MFS transporter [Candidatus Formimonas warabiya]ATW28138.1 MFS transporter [Candidatus Formimonas warabiya]
MNSIKKWLALFALSFGYASAFTVPYAKYIFYDPMMSALNCTNFQLGAMLSVYAFVNLFTYIPGGWLADRFSARKIITISMIAQGIITIWFALSMSLTVGWIVWCLFPLTGTFAYWAAVLKGVRLLGSKEEQGKIFGFFESLVGLSNVIISTIALGIFAWYLDQVAGFKTVIIVYAGFNILAGILTWFLYEDYMTETISERPKVGVKEVLAALKSPLVWLVGVIVLTTYGLYVGLTYLTPYLTAVVGVTVTFSGALAIIRTHGVKLLSGPATGYVVDKIKSASKILIWGNMIVIGFLVVFLNLPAKPAVVMVMVLMLLVAFVGAGMKGVMWSTVEESKIPRYYSGIAIGIASIVGYLADMYMGPLFGYWLDAYGNAGYNYMFAWLIGQSIVGGLAAVGILVLKRKPSLEDTEDISVTG